MLRVPTRLGAGVGATSEGRAWIAALPDAIERACMRFRLSIGEPFEPGGVCSWVAPCTTATGADAVLKLGFPHMEARDEIAGLRFWEGGPAVSVLDADPTAHVLVLERCDPGGSLHQVDATEQDVVIAGILCELWRAPPPGAPFRPLAFMVEDWVARLTHDPDSDADLQLQEDGARALVELAASKTDGVVLATDLHAGNVLQSCRAPWLAIDPKPFAGDRAYDATQHLMNDLDRMEDAPDALVRRMATLLDLDPIRLRAWTFARFATAHRSSDDRFARIARALA